MHWGACLRARRREGGSSIDLLRRSNKHTCMCVRACVGVCISVGVTQFVRCIKSVVRLEKDHGLFKLVFTIGLAISVNHFMVHGTLCIRLEPPCNANVTLRILSRPRAL